MEKLTILSNMDLLQASLIKNAVERFFYKSRFNIAIHKIVTSDEYKEFREKLEDAIKRQILYFAKVDKVNRIVGFTKAVKELTELDLLENLDLFWVSILAFIEEEEFKSHLARSAKEGGQFAIGKTGDGREFLMHDRKVQDKISLRSEKIPDLIDKTTKEWIARTIEEKLLEGASHVEIAKFLRDQALKHARLRSELIAEYEAVLIMGEVEREFMLRNNIVKHKWITSRDELVCPICVANEEAGIISTSDEFPSGHKTTPAHHRCRCFLEPVLPENFELIWWGQ